MAEWAQTLRTARCLLRKPLPYDARTLFERVSGDARVTRYLGWTAHTETAQTQRQISHDLARWQRGAARTWVLVTDDGEPGGLLQLLGQGHSMRLGFALAHDLWGRGLASEALAAILDEAFSHATLYRVEAVSDIGNPRSARTLERVGMQTEGLLRRYILHPNVSPEPRDVFLHAKVRT
ncbi:GNAT family N-acetyltransferase [Methyloversatilis sp. XJ19-13]|uniref:GNAT family N-acetyltransferase n=1 Tax=Methyloversatilis sp. XJ19-13 TaxID=2963430 RepID=UPI00211C57C6|nr:GNAT family N-acetyltransferase [Methyloversatilis sp. XJ19-13]MCQ9372727.1 GNAT family N-acetyltransferase [Methyloversatilis sp. XJ19-13]